MLMYSQASITTLIKKKNKEGPKFKIGDHVRISKYFLHKAIFHIGLKKFLWFKKLKTLCCVHTLLVILTEKELLDCFTKKNCTKKKSHRV